MNHNNLPHQENVQLEHPNHYCEEMEASARLHHYLPDTITIDN
jgi:hypothetical protein